MKAILRNLRRKFSSNQREETELTTSIQDKKPENLRLEETRYTPVEVEEDGGAA